MAWCESLLLGYELVKANFLQTDFCRCSQCASPYRAGIVLLRALLRVKSGRARNGHARCCSVVDLNRSVFLRCDGCSNRGSGLCGRGRRGLRTRFLREARCALDRIRNLSEAMR